MEKLQETYLWDSKNHKTHALGQEYLMGNQLINLSIIQICGNGPLSCWEGHLAPGGPNEGVGSGLGPHRFGGQHPESIPGWRGDGRGLGSRVVWRRVAQWQIASDDARDGGR